MRLGNLDFALSPLGAAGFLLVLVLVALIAATNRMQGRGRMVFRLAPLVLALALATLAVQSLFVAVLTLQLLGLANVFLLLGRNPTLPPLQAQRSAAAALKYVVAMTLSTALLLAGLALVQAHQLEPRQAVLTRVAAAALALGFGLRLAFFPLHLWLPDVCEAATPMASAVVLCVDGLVTGLLLLRVLDLYPWLLLRAGVRPILLLASVASAVLGSLLALGASDLRRSIAYAAIGEMGVIGIALLSGSLVGTVAALLLGLNRAISIFVTCAGAINVEHTGASRHLRQLHGLARRMPLSATALGLVAASSAGLPPTLGFAGRYLALQAAGQQDPRLAAALLVATLLALGYHGRSVYRLFFAGLERPGPGIREQRSLGALSLAVAGVIAALGCYPWPLLRFLSETSRHFAFVQG